MASMFRTFLALVLLSAPAALAGERTYLFRSVEDPASPPDPAVCAQAPFHANVLLGGSLYWQLSGPHDAEVHPWVEQRIGHATACVRLTDLAFPPGLQQDFYIAVELPDGRFTALGTCTVVTNDVPVAGLVQAGCALRVVEAPPGVTGGVLTSLSTFNPRRLPGFSTGSAYTLKVYTAEEPGASTGRQRWGRRRPRESGGE